jgi:PAS domain S-box-containing protein
MSTTGALDQELSQAILQTIPHGIVLFEPQGQIIFANGFAERLLGFQAAEWRDESIICVFLEEDREIFLPNIIKLTMERGSFSGEALLRSRRNREFFAHLTTFLHTVGERELIIAAIQDIGAIKSLQRNFPETERLRTIGKVVDQMAHHIRNPIAAIGGFASRLLKRDLTDNDKELYQEIILQEANRLDDLLRSLANFTTLPVPTLTKESVGGLIEMATSTIPESLRARASAWQTPSDEQLRPLRAFMDLDFLAQGVANVITNSLESRDSNVEISIEADARDDHLRLTLIDNGKGIPPNDLPLVFDPLFTTKNGHVGLGLTISQRIIHDHAGSITIDSEAGQGTTVTMYVPQERRRAVRVSRL